MPTAERSDILLKTKLRPTFVNSRLLPREHLLEASQLARHRLVLIHASAGAGKSSLLSSLVHNQARPAAWYSLTESDFDPGLFLAYILESLAMAYPAAFAALEVGEDWRQLTSNLLNHALEYSEPVLLVLDDYHLVHQHAFVREWMNFVLRHAPHNLTLLVATRELPELPLAMLRSKGLLLEIRPEHLRFEDWEVVKLFKELWKVNLEADLATTLVEKTEGWATALHLVAQATEGYSAQRRRNYVEALEGRESYIYDYLASEVFLLQPEGVRDFLKATAVSQSFCAELAQALVPACNPYVMLDHLEKSRLFLVHLDEEGAWFRYHHLFRDFLNHQVAREHGPERLAELHGKTGRWFQAQGDLASALPHYLEAGEIEATAEHLENSAAQFLARGLHATVQSWLTLLPADFRSSRPGLLLLQAELDDFAGDWAKAVEGYETALKLSRQRGDQDLVTSVLEKLSMCLTKYGEVDRLLATCAEGLTLCDDPSLRSLLLSWQGSAQVMAGRDWDAGYADIRAAHSLALQIGCPRAMVWASMGYGFVYHYPQGNFAESLNVLNEGIAYFRRLGWPMVPQQLMMNKAVVLVMAGELSAAHEVIEDTLQTATECGAHWLAKGLEILKGWALIEGGQLGAARKALESVSLSGIPGQMRPTHYRNWMMLHTLENSLEQAEVSADEMERSLAGCEDGLYSMECRLSRAVLLMRKNELKLACTHAFRALEVARKARAKFWEMKASMVLATLALESDSAELLTHLDVALTLTEQNRYHQFWRTDPWGFGLPLLAWACSRGFHSALVDDLLGDRQAALAPLLPFLRERDSASVAQVIGVIRQMAVGNGQPSLELLSTDTSNSRLRRTALTMLRHQGASRSSLEILALGPFQLLAGGESRLPQAPARMSLRILKYFLTFAPRAISIDELLEAFWPHEAPDAKTRHRLTVQVSRVRTMLGGDVLPCSPNTGYQLVLPPDWSYDVADFERLINEGRSFSQRGTHDIAEARYLRAEQLYRGDFVEEERYEEFIIPRREELRAKYEMALEYLADRAAQRGRFTEALERYRRLVSGDILRESVMEKLLRCLAALGDRAAAHQELDKFCKRIQEHTGLPAEASTRSLLVTLFAS